MSRIGMDSRVNRKISSLRLWVVEQLGSIRHERRVMAAATSLFNLTSSLHNLDSSDLRLLRMAALVHDVGRSIDHKDHPAIGARMIQRETSLRLKKRHRRALAYLTLRHRERGSRNRA